MNENIEIKNNLQARRKTSKGAKIELLFARLWNKEIIFEA